MESVKVFNAELSGLYETKPPISKAKMASITRSAMKAIKFYKHVVQSVEKFILKCKPEYKIPGLYVIDSIVRQSRHQFGADKDVFAPRFARNMESTFANLFRCAPEDKSKIIRVLNLWQKNSVFVPEVIQPLFDLANPDHPMHQQIANQAMQDTSATSNGNHSNSKKQAVLNEWLLGLNTSGMSQESPPQMTDDHNSSSGIHTHQEQQMTPSKPFDQNTIRQLQQFQQILMRQTSGGGDVGNSGNASNKDSVKFNKKLLDFDYGSEEEEEKHSSPHLPNLLPDTNIAQILSDPNVLKQLQNLQKLKQEEKQTKMNEMRLQEEKFEKHLANVLKKLPFANECDLSRQPPNEMPPGMSGPKGEGNEQEVEYVSSDVQVINLDGNDSRSSSPSRDRYKRRKSRSRSRDRRDRRRRSRSRSRERRRRSRSTSRDYKDKDREREKERKRKGLPDIKKEHLSVCSTTLWVGHISKLVQQEELSDTFGKFGDIVSIDMIPPRGCAYIVMNRRQDAHKSMQNLKNHKMQGRPITISWAAGKGVKSKEWKDYWDMELGVCYIPWNKLSSATDLQALEEGGMFDEDTMPSWMKDKSGQSTSSGSAKKTETKDPTPAIPPLFDMARVDTSQPPPAAPMMPMVAPFQMSGVPQFLPIPPNMVPGLQMNVPPPQMMMPGAAHMAPLPGFGVALPPPPPTIPQTSNSSNTNDDHMDIEMEEETTAPPKHDKPAAPQPLLAGPFYNHPPPSLGGIANLTSLLGGHDNNNMQRGDDYDRRNDKDNRPRRDDHGGRDRERDDRRGRDRDRGNDRESRGDNRRDNYRNNDRNNRWGNRGNSRDRERDINSRDREKPGSDYNNRRDRNSFDSESNNSFRGGAAFGQGQGFRDQQGGPRMSGRGDFNRGEDFDRRGGFNQNNRFAGPGARGGMGMGRNGPGFGQQRGGMFMRGPRPGFHFNNDRGGPMNQGMQERGMRNTPNAKFNNSNDRRGGRQNWRDEEERGGFNRFDRNNRRGGSRWEENEDRNRNRSRSPQRPGSDLSNSLPDEDWENLPESNGGFEPSSSNESKKHEYEDNGPPGFENESQDQDNNQGNGAGTPLYDEPQEPVKQTPQMSRNDDMDDRAPSPMPSSQQTSNFEQEPQEHHHQQHQQRDERLEQQPPSPPLHSSSTAQSVEYRSESPEFHSQQQQYQEQEEQQQKQYQEQEEQQQNQHQELEQQQHQQPDPEPQPMPENNEPAESAEGDEA